MENGLVDKIKPTISLNHFSKRIRKQGILTILMSIEKNTTSMRNIEQYLIEKTVQKRML